VPSLLTWLLQPLDVAVFAIFKRLLMQHFLREAGAHDDEHHIVTAIRHLVTCTRDVLCGRDWSPVFQRLGLAGTRPPTSKTLKKELGWVVPPAIPRTRPTLLELKTLWPGRIVFHEGLMLTVLPPLPAAPAEPIAPHVEVALEPAPDIPFSYACAADPDDSAHRAAAAVAVAALADHPRLRLRTKTTTDF